MAGLLLAGKTICCAASWVRTSLPMKLWAQVSSRPDTISVTARNRPATLTSTSKVRRLITVLPRKTWREGSSGFGGRAQRARSPGATWVRVRRSRPLSAVVCGGRRGRAGGHLSPGEEGAELGNGGHQRGGELHGDVAMMPITDSFSQ